MSIKIFSKYTPRANAPDTNYPEGSIKNESVPSANDGTPLDQDWGNDMEGYTQALLAEAGITASGNPDTALVSDRFEALLSTIRKRTGIITLQSFGAVDDAVFGADWTGTDNTSAIQNAVNFAISNKLRIVGFKTESGTGKYLVTSPIIAASGQSTATAVDSFTMEFFNNSIVYNTGPTSSGKLPDVSIVTPNAFPEQSIILDLSFVKNVYLNRICIENNNGKGICFWMGKKGAEVGGFSQSTMIDCSFAGAWQGGRFEEAGLNHITRMQVSGMSNLGIIHDASGDTTYSDCYFNTNNVDFTGDDLYTGSGLVIANGSNNINYRGGKVEWNAKGIMLNGVQGINIVGVQFDVNKVAPICIIPDFTNPPTINATSISITGCRFLAGGVTKISAGDVGGSHISITANSGKTASVAVSGNTFVAAGVDAFDQGTTAPVGPTDAVIRSRGAGIIDVAASGNMANGGSNTNFIEAGNDNHTYRLSGNITDLPNSGSNKIFESENGLVSADAANQTISNNTVHTIIWNTPVVDDIGAFSGGQPTRMTVPVGTSRVDITFSLDFQTTGIFASSDLNFDIKKNGVSGTWSILTSLEAASGAFRRLNFVVPTLFVTGGDYFEIDVIQKTGLNNVPITGTFTNFTMKALKGGG